MQEADELHFQQGVLQVQDTGPDDPSAEAERKAAETENLVPKMPPLMPASMWTRKDLRVFKDTVKKCAENVIRIGSLATATVSGEKTAHPACLLCHHNQSPNTNRLHIQKKKNSTLGELKRVSLVSNCRKMCTVLVAWDEMGSLCSVETALNFCYVIPVVVALLFLSSLDPGLLSPWFDSYCRSSAHFYVFVGFLVYFFCCIFVDQYPPIAAASMWTRKDIKDFKDSIRKDADSVIKVGSGETVTVSRSANSTAFELWESLFLPLVAFGSFDSRLTVLSC